MFIVPVTRESRQLSRLFDETLDRFFGAAGTSITGADAAAGPRSPALDVVESERGYTVNLEVPGVAKEDVKVSIDGRRVNVQAQSARGDEQRDGERIVYRERAVTSYARSFTLPVEVEQAEAGAKLEHGVLTLTLPKRGARNAATLTIN